MAKTELNKYMSNVNVADTSFTVLTMEYHVEEHLCTGDFLELTIFKRHSNHMHIRMFELETTHQKPGYAKALHDDVTQDIQQNSADYINIFQSLKEHSTKLTSLLEEKLQNLVT